MKVCMVAYALYSTDARIKSYVRTLKSRNHSVDILCLREEAGTDCHSGKGIRIFYVSKKYQGSNKLFYILSYIKFFILTSLTLSYLFFRHRYNVVHVHNMPNFIVFTALLPKLFRKTVILDIHDLMPINYVAKFNISENGFIYRFLLAEQTASTKFASKIICADHMQKTFLTEITKVPETKVTVIMNLPHREIFKRYPRTKENSYFNLVYHGTISERLGIDILIRSIALLENLLPARLFIFGSGDYLKDAIKLANDLHLANNIYFSRQYFPVERIPSLLRNMDVGVVPYKNNIQTNKYGLSVKMMEYLYLGIPAIVPFFEINRFYFDETMVKYYEPESIEELAKSIVELFNNKKDRENLLINSEKFFLKYNWEKQEGAYMDCIG